MKYLSRTLRLFLLAAIAVPAVVVQQGCKGGDDIAPTSKDQYNAPAAKINPYKAKANTGNNNPMGAPTPPPD